MNILAGLQEILEHILKDTTWEVGYIFITLSNSVQSGNSNSVRSGKRKENSRYSFMLSLDFEESCTVKILFHQDLNLRRFTCTKLYVFYFGSLAR